jgi:hypothetical protein
MDSDCYLCDSHENPDIRTCSIQGLCALHLHEIFEIVNIFRIDQVEKALDGTLREDSNRVPDIIYNEIMEERKRRGLDA